ncbi:MAG: HTH-type transcriptional regulator RutR [Comamonas sp.]
MTDSLPSRARAARAPRKKLGPPGRATRQQSMQDKRAAIVQAALALFSRYGLHGTAIDQIAGAAGVSKSNLLYHFGSKEDLYVSVLRELLALWLEPLRGFSAEQDPAQALAGYIRRKLALSRDRPDASRLFCLEMIQGAPLLRDELASALRELVERKSEVIHAWIAAGRLADVDPHHLLFQLWATTQHYADFAVQVEAVTGQSLRDAAFFESTVAQVTRTVLHGVLPSAPGTAADGAAAP